MKAILRRLLFGTAFAVFLASTFNASAFYDTTIGRWASRDPIGERGGENLHGFVFNDPINDADSLGQKGLKFISEGKTFADGRINGYKRGSKASGEKASAASWYEQTLEVKYCPGGLCNSGGTEDQGSSFVTAWVENTDSCTVSVDCSCRVSWSGMTFIPKVKVNQNAKRLGGFTVKGHVLDREFGTKNDKGQTIPIKVDPENTSDINWGWYAIGVGNETEVKQFQLTPGAKKQLYHGNIIVAIGPFPGGVIYERMSADCSCVTTKQTPE
jgi:hypothetical protein